MSRVVRTFSFPLAFLRDDGRTWVLEVRVEVMSQPIDGRTVWPTAKTDLGNSVFLSARERERLQAECERRAAESETRDLFGGGA